LALPVREKGGGFYNQGRDLKSGISQSTPGGVSTGPFLIIHRKPISIRTNGRGREGGEDWGKIPKKKKKENGPSTPSKKKKKEESPFLQLGREERRNNIMPLAQRKKKSSKRWLKQPRRKERRRFPNRAAQRKTPLRVWAQKGARQSPCQQKKTQPYSRAPTKRDGDVK